MGLMGRVIWHDRGRFEVGGLMLAFAMIGVGVLASIRPTIPLEWAKRAHPDLPLDSVFLLIMTRAIGGALLFIGPVFLLN
jgi:hypothetical protein